MKRMKKEHIISACVLAAYIVNFIFVAACYMWIKYDNEQMRTVELSAEALEDGSYVLNDFTVGIGPRGGDSGAWLKDSILDENGNELHGRSVGTIYEMTLTNTTKATITDWTMKLYVPEEMWFNNAWCGTLEFYQTTSGELKVQELDLREFTSKPIEIDHYIDHTGPMIAMAPGDSFIYHPSKADNEMPLEPQSDKEETNSTALMGFIVYVPEKPLDYLVNFEKAEFSYYLQRSPWSSSLFITLVGLDIVWLVLFIALLVSQIRIRQLLRQQKHDAKIIEQSIKTFINFIEAKDPHTKGHSERVAKISYALAVDMGYPQRECERIYYTGLMHDCGKISIPVNILRKPGKLTDEEFETVRLHTIEGEKMLRDFTSIDGIGLGVLYHHERYDGKGYPKGIAGEDIPLIARIICVADSLDAMNSDRYYRPRLTKEEILADIEFNKGKQFDPIVVDHLLKLIKHGIITIGE